MSRAPGKRRPGDLEIRIRPDGRVYIAEADEAMLDVCQALDPNNPVLVKRRKGKSKNDSRGAQAR
ncbi:MAG: hypothetical protein ABSA67_00775 [Candidatus Brocadiia bacterium]|jgi:hypothetical protein